MNSLADAVASPASVDNEPLPYGRSHWDRKPAELHAMILRAAGPLTLFVNGLLGDKDNLDEATVEALWTDVISIDWQGDLALLPDITIYAGEVYSLRCRPALDMLSLSVSRSMYGRLCTRFPAQAIIYPRHDPRQNQYQVDSEELFTHFETTRLRHIPMRNCWFDLVDFSYPIILGWLAIRFGHTGLLKHLVGHHGVDLAKFQSLDGRLAMDQAALHGHLEVLQMLHEAGNKSCSTWAMDRAARNGRLDMVQWLHANRTEGCTTKAMDSAAENGHLDVIKWLHENRTEGCTTEAMDGTAASGHLDVVKWLHENRTEGCTTRAMNGAANGHLDVVKWLHANKTEGCTSWAIYIAAMNGHIEVVQFLIKSGYEFTFDALREAKSGAIIDALVDSMTLARAMELLRRARSNRRFSHLIERLERAVEDKQA